MANKHPTALQAIGPWHQSGISLCPNEGGREIERQAAGRLDLQLCRPWGLCPGDGEQKGTPIAQVNDLLCSTAKRMRQSWKEIWEKNTVVAVRLAKWDSRLAIISCVLSYTLKSHRHSGKPLSLMYVRLPLLGSVLIGIPTSWIYNSRITFESFP